MKLKSILLFSMLLVAGLLSAGCSGGSDGDSAANEKPLEGAVESTEATTVPGDMRSGGEQRDGDK